MVGAEIKRVRASWSERDGSVKQHGVRASDSVGAEPSRRRSTTKERPLTFTRIGHVGYPRHQDLRVRAVEIGVIHGDAGGIPAALVDGGVAAVAKIGANPGAIGLHEFRTIVLGPADGEIRVRWMNGEAHKLRGVE